MIENSGSAPMFLHSNPFETIPNGAELMAPRHSESGEQWFTAFRMAQKYTFVLAVKFEWETLAPKHYFRA